MPFAAAQDQGLIEIFDASLNYIDHIKKLIDLEPIKKAGLTIVVDAMWGNGAGWFTRLLAGDKTKVIEIHNHRNPIFPEMKRPEPIQPNIDVGLKTVVDMNGDVLLITDGDADRVGVGDENGVFVNQLQVYALLAYYLLSGACFLALVLGGVLNSMGWGAVLLHLFFAAWCGWVLAKKRG